jgi:hypothetical protein
MWIAAAGSLTARTRRPRSSPGGQERCDTAMIVVAILEGVRKLRAPSFICEDHLGSAEHWSSVGCMGAVIIASYAFALAEARIDRACLIVSGPSTSFLYFRPRVSNPTPPQPGYRRPSDPCYRMRVATICCLADRLPTKLGDHSTMALHASL